MRNCLLLVTVTSLVLAGCASSASTSSTTDAGPGAALDAGSSPSVDAGTSAATDAGVRANERTLDTCTTNIDANAPEFYKRYFKCVTVTTSATGVTISSTGLPPHRSYYYGSGNANFEEFDTTRGSEYRANPNRIATKVLAFGLPNTPVSRNLTVSSSLVDGTVGTSSNEYPMGAAGMALDGVALFNPLAAPGDNIETEKYTFDVYDGHPPPDGSYHYHTTSKGPLEVLKKAGLITTSTPGSASIELYGIMCDGTPVLGCKELDESSPSGSLDAQGGHTHDLKDKAGTTLLAGRYHTHICPTSATGRKFTPEIQYYSSCTR
jgi:hypothetical protein